MATGAKEGIAPLLHPAQAFELSKGKSIQEFAKSIKQITGREISIVGESAAEQQAFSQMVQQVPGLAGGAASVTFSSGKEAIIFNPTVLREQFIKTAVGHTKLSKETALKAIESEQFLHSVLYHEALEAQVKDKFSKLTMMPTHHHGSQVLIGEGGFIRLTGNKELSELYSSIRGLRSEEKAVTILCT